MTTYSLPDFSSKLSLVVTTGLHTWIQALAEKSINDKLHVQSKLSPWILLKEKSSTSSKLRLWKLASTGCLLKRPLTVLHCINIIFRMEIQHIVLNNRTILLKEDIGVYGNCVMVDSFSWGINITQYYSNCWFNLVVLQCNYLLIYIMSPLRLIRTIIK